MRRYLAIALLALVLAACSGDSNYDDPDPCDPDCPPTDCGETEAGCG
ncbi:MAG TPA: lipoprotein [Candidatus Methylomirabilis sp.]|nr:lipoprotein [Candidatus Methylomirabilis sp.]